MSIQKWLLLLGIGSFAGMVDAFFLEREQLKDFIVHDNGDDIIQLSVPSQFKRQNGDASCGYEAIFNGCAIRNILYVAAGDRLDALTSLKEDEDERDRTFGSKESPWRQAIAIKREQKKAQEALEEQIGFMFKGVAICLSKERLPKQFRYRTLLNKKVLQFPLASSPEEQAFWDALWQETCNVARDLSCAHRELKENELAYTISADEIQQQFLVRLQGRVDNPETEKQAMYAALNNEAKLAEFIEFDEAAVRVPLNDVGNWLESDEIEYVLREGAKDDMISTFILGGTLCTDKPLTKDKLVKKSDIYKSFISDFQKDGIRNQTGIFLIYTCPLGATPEKDYSDMSNKDATESATQSNSHGHWICVVAHKVGAKRQLIIANSLANSSYIDHYRVKELRCLLQGVDYESDGTFHQWIENERLVASPAAFLKRHLEDADEHYLTKGVQYIFTNKFDIDSIGSIKYVTPLGEKKSDLTLGSYLNERLHELESDVSVEGIEIKNRIEMVLLLFKDTRSGLPASQKRLQSEWVKPENVTGVGLNNDSDENLATLILHCAEHPARMEELMNYLILVKGTRELALERISYQGGTLAPYYQKLSGRKCPHKDRVGTLLREHTLRELMLKPHDATNFADFVNYFRAHPCDVDKVPYSLDPQEKTYASLGDWLKAQEGDSQYASMVSAVKQYRLLSPANGNKQQALNNKNRSWTSMHYAFLAAVVSVGWYLLHKRMQQTPQKNKDLQPRLPHRPMPLAV